MAKNLANVKEKKVKIELDRVRYVKFGFDAFALLEEKFGTLEKAMEALSEGKLATMKTLLWAGLQEDLADGEELTEKQLGKMLDFSRLNEVVSAITEAINNALPEVKEEASLKNE